MMIKATNTMDFYLPVAFNVNMVTTLKIQDIDEKYVLVIWLVSDENIREQYDTKKEAEDRIDYIISLGEKEKVQGSLYDGKLK